MKKYGNSYRPSAASLGKKKRVVRQKGPSFFFKFFLISISLLIVTCGGWLAVTSGYRALVNSTMGDWHVKTLEVQGVAGNISKEITSLVQPFMGKPFSVKDAAALKDGVEKRYPMLKNVSVRRGLLNGKLTVSARRRTPVAKFVLPDDSVRYIDGDSTVYDDPNPDLLKPVPFVELVGKVPEKLSSEFIDLVESTLKLSKELDFAFLQMNLTNNTVKMYMPDGCVIDFGTAVHLKQKALRAAQVLAYEREHQAHAKTVDFHFFEEGKVFLTHSSN